MRRRRRRRRRMCTGHGDSADERFKDHQVESEKKRR
jgi:hypothetical protein